MRTVSDNFTLFFNMRIAGACPVISFLLSIKNHTGMEEPHPQVKTQSTLIRFLLTKIHVSLGLDQKSLYPRMKRKSSSMQHFQWKCQPFDLLFQLCFARMHQLERIPYWAVSTKHLIIS